MVILVVDLRLRYYGVVQIFSSLYSFSDCFKLPFLPCVLSQETRKNIKPRKNSFKLEWLEDQRILQSENFVKRPLK